MMKNEFIPYEEALALKELGFDEFTVAAYVDNELDIGGLWKDSVTSKVIHKAPLYQQAFRWFREKYNCHYNLFAGVNKWSYVVVGIKQDTEEGFETYQEAQDACLRKLIEIVNQNKDE